MTRRPWPRCTQAANEANGETEYVNARERVSPHGNLTHLDPAEDVVLAFVGERLVRLVTDRMVRYSRRRAALSSVTVTSTRTGDAEASAGRCWTATRPSAGAAREGQDDAGAERARRRGQGSRRRAALRSVRAHGYERVRVYHHMVRPDMERHRYAVPWPTGSRSDRSTHDQLTAALGGHGRGLPRPLRRRSTRREAAFRRWSEDPDWTSACRASPSTGTRSRLASTADRSDENEAQGYRRGWTDPVFTRRPWRRRGLAPRPCVGETLVNSASVA